MSLPASYFTHVLEVTRRFGVDDADVLGDVSLGDEVRLELPQIRALVQRARELTGEPGLGVYLGLAMRASWHGYLGFAVLVARDVGDALRLGERFIATRTSSLGLRSAIEHGRAVITIDEKEDFGDARDFIVPALAIGLSSIGQALTGHELDGRVELAMPEPTWFARLAATNPRLTRISFGAKAHRLMFDAALLKTPFQLADANAQKLAAEQCEKELAALEAAGGFAPRVRELLFANGGVRDVDAVAKTLSMSARTLKRRLQSEGTSYSELLEHERHARAELLLSQGTLSVKEVAAQLGYADTAAFSHAFTRWTGQSPSEFQRTRTH
ncbi:MAG: AraC family transcriptional regulator ligand-binding domain-containing protein [Archangium sp.]